MKKKHRFFFQAVNSIEINCIVILTFTTSLCFISGMNYSPKHTANGSNVYTLLAHTWFQQYNGSTPLH